MGPSATEILRRRLVRTQAALAALAVALVAVVAIGAGGDPDKIVLKGKGGTITIDASNPATPGIWITQGNGNLDQPTVAIYCEKTQGAVLGAWAGHPRGVPEGIDAAISAGGALAGGRLRLSSDKGAVSVYDTDSLPKGK